MNIRRCIPLLAPLALMAAATAAEPRPGPFVDVDAATASEVIARVSATEHVAPVMATVTAPKEMPRHADWLVPEEDAGPGLSFQELPGHLGRPVTVLTRGKRLHRGTLLEVSGKQLTLRVRQAGGSAVYTLPRNQVLRIESR